MKDLFYLLYDFIFLCIVKQRPLLITRKLLPTFPTFLFDTEKNIAIKCF